MFAAKGGRKHIVAPDGSELVKARGPSHDSSMIKALVRGFEFLDKLDKDEDLTAKDIAETENLDASYVNKYIRMTQLAPDIIQSILSGFQPQTLTMSQLMRPFPDILRAVVGAASWPEKTGNAG